MLLYALLMLQQYANPCCTASNLNTPELCMVTTGGGGGLVTRQIMHRGYLHNPCLHVPIDRSIQCTVTANEKIEIWSNLFGSRL